MAHILIVEDEPEINNLIAKNLTLVGHQCKQVFDGNAALTESSAYKFDLILLDVLLPGIDGFSLIDRLGNAPVIFLTALSSLSDRVKGLNLGADDYIVKPFEALELIARVNAVLRRTKKADTQFTHNGVQVDLSKRSITKDGVPIEVTPKEFDVLETLIINRNIALSREKLLDLAWGYDYAGETRTVDSHIQRLRMKLGWEDDIKTVYKLGYRLEI